MPRLRRPRFPLLAARRTVAAGLAVLALVLAMRPGAEPADRPPPGSPVVVAAAPLPAGTALSADHLRVVRFPAEAVPDGVARAPDVLLHRVLAGPVRAGEPLTDARLVGPGLTDLLPAGQVAAPVRLADLAVAALVRTGDRVDVLAAGAEGRTAERVASDALVLAAPGADGGDDPGAGLLLLAVDPETAARLATAAATATLTVSLPPPPS